MKKKPILAILGSALLIPTLPGFGKAADADAKIPAVYPVVYENGNYYYHNVLDNEKYPKEVPSERYAPESLIGNPTGSKTGIDFAFPEIASSFSVEDGRLYMGLIPF